MPNKVCALINDVCLITRFYSNIYYIKIIIEHTSVELAYARPNYLIHTCLLVWTEQGVDEKEKFCLHSSKSVDVM